MVERFGIDATLPFNVQCFEQEWNDYVDVEKFDMLPDKSKLRCSFLTRPEVVLSPPKPTNADTSITDQQSRSVCDVTVNVSAVPTKDVSTWPSPFLFPVKKLPCTVYDALNNRVNLLNPKQRYYRGQLVKTLCHEALSIKSHPNNSEKIDLARSIICTWPYLKEPIGRGFDGWLSSVVEGLKAARRELGLADAVRSAAVRKRKLQISFPHSVDIAVATSSLVKQSFVSSKLVNDAAHLTAEETSATAHLHKLMDNDSGSKRVKRYNKQKKPAEPQPEHSASSCTEQKVVTRPKTSLTAADAAATADSATAAERLHEMSRVDSTLCDIVCQPPVLVDMNNNGFADWYLYETLPAACQPTIDASLIQNITPVDSSISANVKTLDQSMSVANSFAAAWCTLNQADQLDSEAWNQPSLPRHSNSSSKSLTNPVSASNSELQAELSNEFCYDNSSAAICEVSFSPITAGTMPSYVQAPADLSQCLSAGNFPMSCTSSCGVLSSDLSSATSAGCLPSVATDVIGVNCVSASRPAASVVGDGVRSSTSKPYETLAKQLVGVTKNYTVDDTTGVGIDGDHCGMGTIATAEYMLSKGSQSSRTVNNLNVCVPAVSTGVSSNEILKENSFVQHAIDEMQREWNLPVKDMKKLLHLLQITYEDRRKLIYNHSTTAVVRQTYPALFCQEAIQQEFEQVSGSCISQKLTKMNVIDTASKFVQAAERLTLSKGSTLTKSYRNGTKMNVIGSVLQQLNLAIEHCDDAWKQKCLKATAGLVLLPWLLAEKAEYFCKVYEVYTIIAADECSS